MACLVIKLVADFRVFLFVVIFIVLLICFGVTPINLAPVLQSSDSSHEWSKLNSEYNESIRYSPHVKIESPRSRKTPKDVSVFLIVIARHPLPQGAPKLTLMKKSPVSTQNLGSFPSPGATNYRDASVGSQKGWSSERVAQPASSSRRHTSLAGLTPFNSGRTLPSKWDEAERWICSPVSGYVNTSKGSHAQLHQRRPKSKSGPIVPPGIAYYSNYSPTVPLGIKNLMAGSPFSTGVLAPDAVSVHTYDIDNGVQYANGVLPLISAPRWSELLCCDPSSPNSQDEKDDEIKNEDTVVSHVSKLDKATQMSSETDSDAHSPTKSSPTSATDQQSFPSTKLQVRDVQVDSQATITRWSKMTKNNSLRGKDLGETRTEAQASSWDLAVAHSTMNMTKAQREEAKIIAWENLQQAKAEAAIQKLEMKLEKKRSTSMDKILNKLRWAQMKAEKMRNLIPVQQDHQTSKKFSFPKYAQIWSRRSCFSSHDL